MSTDERFVRMAELAEQGLLSSALAHELRQPLFALRGQLQLALVRGESISSDHIAELLEQVAHAERLLVHYTGETPAESQLLDVAAEVRAAVEMVEPRARQAGVSLQIDLLDSMLVRARPSSVRQVVANLLTNAVDAAKTCADTHVSLDLKVVDGWATLEVSDKGAGIDDAVASTMFEPFVTTKEPGEGTGLGLFVAKRRVEAAGGEVRVDNHTEGGVVAMVRWPLAT